MNEANLKFNLDERELFSSKEGTSFNVWSSRWRLSSSRTVSVGFIDEYLPIEQTGAIRRTLAQRASVLEGATLAAIIADLKNFLKGFIEDREEGISIDSLINLYAAKSLVNVKLNIKALLLQAVKMGFEDAFELGTDKFLDQVVVGDRKGRYNAEKSELTRAFTDYERNQFIYQLTRARHLGQLSNKEYLYLKLLFVTGKRPVQIKKSKISDFETETLVIGGSNRKILRWRCPVAKQKGALFREEFNDVPLSSELNIEEDIELVASESIANVERYFGVELTESQKGEVPLFCALKYVSAVRASEIEQRGLAESLKSSVLHDLHGGFASLVMRNSDLFAISSERTGEFLNIYPRRFRHTFATNLALSGATEAEIANALDHSGLQSIKHYTNNLPMLAIKVGEKVESTLGALIKRFDREQELSLDDASIIRHYTKHKSEDVGNCGKESFCQEDYPYACYTCELFVPNPWGNHQAVLDDVERKLAKATEIGDQRMVENWRIVQIGIMERKFLSDQVRIKMLNEVPNLKAIGGYKEVKG